MEIYLNIAAIFFMAPVNLSNNVLYFFKFSQKNKWYKYGDLKNFFFFIMLWRLIWT